MTAQQLREKASNAVQELMRAALCIGSSRSGNETANHKASLAKYKAEYLETIALMTAQLESAQKDALAFQKLKLSIPGTMAIGPRMTLQQIARAEGWNSVVRSMRAAIDAALNPAREDVK